MSGPIYITCHCQDHVVQLHLPDGVSVDTLIDQATTDDCSHCVKRRLLWYRIADGVEVEVVKGFGKAGVQLKEYTFALHRLAHQFCGRCGTHVSAKYTGVKKYGSEGPAGSIAMLNLRALREPSFNMKEHFHLLDEPLYTHVQPADLEGAQACLEKRKQVYAHETKLYAGSCHCQAIRYAVLCKPLSEQFLLDCTCSICRGNGLLWMYPGRRNAFFSPSVAHDIPWMPDRSLLTMYEWGDREIQFWFCSRCGCQVLWTVDWGSDRDPNPSIALGRELENKEEEVDRVGKKAFEWNRSFGLNAALLTAIRDYMGDVHSVRQGGNERDAPKGLGGLRTNNMAWEDPIYCVSQLAR